MSQTKTSHRRRWRELRSTPENFERLFNRLTEEIDERNAATFGKPCMPACEVFSFHEKTETFPAYVLMVSPRCEIRFLLEPGIQLFKNRRDASTPLRIRPIYREFIDQIEWRYAKKAAA